MAALAHPTLLAVFSCQLWISWLTRKDQTFSKGQDKPHREANSLPTSQYLSCNDTRHE